MPATEQTWRDSKLLHLVFGISALAMLVSTIWMLAADHRREWKTFQRKFREIETWSAQARISEQQSSEYEQKLRDAHQAVEKARSDVPAADLINQFNQQVRDRAGELGESVDLSPVDNTYQALAKAPAEQRPALREQLRAALAGYVDQAVFFENGRVSLKKFRAADLDVARSEYEIGIGNGLPQARLDAMQARVDEIRQLVDEANDEMQDANGYRVALTTTIDEMFASQTAAEDALKELQTELVQLEKTLYERRFKAMNEVVSMPIIDAFAPQKVDQIWLPNLTINYNFSDVARFDRCTNCHLAIERTAPGSAVDPAYPSEHTVVLSMATPDARPKSLAQPRTASGDELLGQIYGLRLSEKGLLDPDDAVVSVVRPLGAAAKANVEVGDRIAQINDVRIFEKRTVYNELLESVQWGRPIKLTVRRGLPNPYSSHPRLDLFVGSLSPHKKDEMGCTICHDGQGSATAFKWASHAPNDPLQSDLWKREYGWFDNHHWIYPMYPKRFSESLCLKCHHDVTELEPSEQYPEPPAPKLVEGFQLIKHYGCFGCHEIVGYDGPTRRVGPDLRAEPSYAPAAEALLAQGGLSEQQQQWARQVIEFPDAAAARHSLRESLANAETLPGDPVYTEDLLDVLGDVETPGKLRKVGPSLRHVASKVGFDFLYSWIRKPSDYRPSTKMPQFFGLWSALGHDGLEVSKRYEPIEIRGITEFLLSGSQPFEYATPPDDVAEPSIERGKYAFEVRCLACHKHEDFPQATMSQGPDLSRLGAKLGAKANPNGPKWLYTWLLNPSSYHPRTLMPDMILDPVPGAEGKLIDPAADIAAFLLSSTDWQPTDVPSREMNDAEREALDDLAMEHLQTAFSKRQAKKYLENGIPERLRDELKGDEVELVGPISLEKKLRYVGRRSISKYGCSGCHDIPDFEDAKPIGTGLADWGRKAADRLAFEQIVEYLKHGHGDPGALEYSEQYDHGADVTDAEIEQTETSGSGHDFNYLNMDPDTGYFMKKLVHHQREGFIWQKLREPRSYDYKKTRNKSYNERLRMPKFTALSDAEREAIITFVLGLVAEPPPEQYVYQAKARRAAIVQGNEVIEKYNCTGCHTLEMDRWELAYEPDQFGEPAPMVDYPFLAAHFSPQEVEESKTVDSAGLLHATVTGMPLVDDAGLPIRVDEDGAPLEADDTETPASYVFVPWESVLLGGNAWQAGLQNLLIPESTIRKQHAPRGGFLARLAFPAVVAQGKTGNPNLKADEVWGWLPPPLHGEGRKVQTQWLHDFLLDPHEIRPAAVLRMPKFNMSQDEATKLVNYFAAVDRVDYPYDFDPRTRQAHLEAEQAAHPTRMADALRIMTDNSYCVKCHILGDYDPRAGGAAGGEDSSIAPQLSNVFRRLRPQYTLDWIANPKRILPYTGMPVNIPYDKPVSQQLYQGDSTQQLDAVVDLLLNWDRYAESEISIKPLIKSQATPAAGLPTDAAEGQAAAQ